MFCRLIEYSSLDKSDSLKKWKIHLWFIESYAEHKKYVLPISFNFREILTKNAKNDWKNSLWIPGFDR